MKPSLGVLIGLPVAGLIVLAAIGLILGSLIYAARERDWFPALTGGGVGIAAIIVTLVVTGFLMWPWSAEYHEWQTESGTIAAVNSRLLASGTQGGGSTQRFVVEFAGSGDQFSCDDTRCSLLKPGDYLTLSCKRAYQYTGTPGYDCNYVDSEAASK
jgi:hypothetical protein